MKPEIRCGQHISNWNYYKIGELCELLTGFPFPGCQIVKTGKNLLMRGINITEGYIRHSEDIDRYYDGHTTNLEKYRLKTGDLVIGMDGSKVGKNSALITSKENNSLLVQRVARLRNKDRNLIRLIQITVSSSKFLKYIEEMKTSSAIPHISPTDIKDFTISLPTDLNERNLLASYFQSLDSLIQTTSKKLASLKQIKAASLQSMFPQEGETVPKVRFKGFEGEWDFVTAGEVFRTTNVRNRPDLPVLSATQDKGMVKRSDIGYQVFHDKSNETTYKHILPGQFIIHLRSFQGGFAHSNIEGIVSPAYTVMEFKNKEFHYDYFWKYIFTSKEFIKRLELITYGIRDGRTISFDEFKEMDFFIPSKLEQQKIASYFCNLDKQISLQTQRLEKLKQIKAACLDKMFV